MLIFSLDDRQIKDDRKIQLSSFVSSLSVHLLSSNIKRVNQSNMMCNWDNDTEKESNIVSLGMLLLNFESICSSLEEKQNSGIPCLIIASSPRVKWALIEYIHPSIKREREIHGCLDKCRVLMKWSDRSSVQIDTGNHVQISLLQNFRMKMRRKEVIFRLSFSRK